MLKLLKQLASVVFAWKQIEMKGKNPFRSKTVWANVIAVAAGLLSDHFGVTLAAGEQLVILAVVNIALRLITKQPVGFYEET